MDTCPQIFPLPLPKKRAVRRPPKVPLGRELTTQTHSAHWPKSPTLRKSPPPKCTWRRPPAPKIPPQPVDVSYQPPGCFFRLPVHGRRDRSSVKIVHAGRSALWANPINLPINPAIITPLCFLRATVDGGGSIAIGTRYTHKSPK